MDDKTELPTKFSVTHGLSSAESAVLERLVMLITPRERYLMQAATDAAPYYRDIEQWLNEPIDDCGHTVEDLLNYEASEAI